MPIRQNEPFSYFKMASRKADSKDLILKPKWSYPDDVPRKVFEASRDGKAVELKEVFQQMTIVDGGDTSERATVLEAKTAARTSSGFDGELTPLIAAADRGNLDCVKILIRHNADIDGRAQDEFFGTFTPSLVAAANGHLMLCLHLAVYRGKHLLTKPCYVSTVFILAQMTEVNLSSTTITIK